MKIAIIGGGWVGCHLTHKLRKKHDVTLFEKNNKLFQETSYKNQNRLHLGYHYVRNSKTRKMCLDTFDRFLKDYKFLTKKIKKNLYCVPKETSLVDFETISKIFDLPKSKKKLQFEKLKYEGCIKTKERYIDFIKTQNFFNEELKDNFIQKEIKYSEIKKLSNEFDFVINCTNNFLSKNDEKNFYELTLSLIYKKIKKTNFDALTLIDGKLFSIFPYYENYYTLTDVEHTPIKKFNDIDELLKFSSTTTFNYYLERKELFEKKVLRYYPNFTEDFIFDSFFTSIKSKTLSESENRFPIIQKNKNIINCFTGKIQGIFIIEDYIKKNLNK